jgi:hypothetical protein
MATKKVSELSTQASALTGAETSHIVQSGASKYVTETQRQTLAHAYPIEATPSAPSSGLVQYAQQIAGISTPRIRSELGIHRLAFDPVGGSELIITPSTSTSLGNLGNSITTTGTISHPTITTTGGRVGVVTSAASVAATAGTSSAAQLYIRGNNTGPYQGFSLDGLFSFPDATYNQTGASTGSRNFIGFTDQTLATMVGADNPAGNYCGFFRCSVNGGLEHSSWRFVTKDGTTQNLADTGVTFTATNIYELSIFVPPASSAVYWSIRNVTAGTAVVSGSTSTNVPSALSVLRSGMQVGTVDAVARAIGLAAFRSRGFYTQV